MVLKLDLSSIQENVSTMDASPVILSSNLIQDFRDSVQTSLGGFVYFAAIFWLLIPLTTVCISQIASSFRTDQNSNERRDRSRMTAAFFPWSPDPNFPLWLTLVLSVMIDVAGDASFLIPGVGELEDIVWGPLAALLLKSLYGSNVIALITLTKELLPFTDFIPTATFAFVISTFFSETLLGKFVGLNKRNETER